MTTRPTLLLLPGLLCDERLWRDQIAGLADIADIAVADLARDDTIAAMAARALAMLDARGTASFAVCGLSMGASVSARAEVSSRPRWVTRAGAWRHTSAAT